MWSSRSLEKELSRLSRQVDEKKKLSQGASTSGIFTIELYSFPSISWVYDTGYGTHICITTQGLMGSRKLKPGALSLYVGDGHRATVEVIGEFHLCLPTKLNLDSALLWHCHLGHISKKLIEKLQHDGLLDSTNIKSFEKCVSCMSGKMERKPYSHQVARAKDLLGLIHTDNKVFVARNIEFLENSLIDQEASGSLEDLEIIQEEDTHPSLNTSLHHEEDDQEIDEPQSDIIPIRKSFRTRRGPNQMCLHINVEEHELGDLGEPANYKAALLDHESDKWLNAMNVEMQSMRDNEVWELVDLPSNGKTVGHKWLFKKKTDMDGAVHTYKACLVAKGFTQTPGIDYEETFSPVANTRVIRILIAIAAFYGYEIWQMDVKTRPSYNGHLSEEVYMEQPEGFVNLKYLNRKFGFSQNRDEPCVYMKASGSYVTFLILYVDDILIMGNNIPMLQDVKSYLGRCFAMKDLGEAAYILGIKIYRDRSRRLIGLCQSAYIEKILKRYFMENSKRGTIPMQEKLKLSKSQGASTPAKKQRMQNVPYASAVGSIMYAVRCTRPDVAFAQNITSRFQQNPGELHWTTVKNILKYLRNTKDMFLVYGGDMKRELRVSCYTDVGYLTDADDLKSQTGYSWYITAYDASKEAVWVRKFISGLGVVPTIEEPINMYCDNTRAITIANEFGTTKGARISCQVH
ncbi:retrotransposon protein, putative, ty1-copia subclass [Tanacetum coccineum]